MLIELLIFVNVKIQTFLNCATKVQPIFLPTKYF